jgi:hypothetical protein
MRTLLQQPTSLMTQILLKKIVVKVLIKKEPMYLVLQKLIQMIKKKERQLWFSNLQILSKIVKGLDKNQLRLIDYMVIPLKQD